MDFPALKFSQNGKTAFQLALSNKEFLWLKEHCSIEKFDDTLIKFMYKKQEGPISKDVLDDFVNNIGYQREYNKNRANKFTKFMKTGFSPTSILINDRMKSCSFESSPGSNRFGILSIPDKARLTIPDGQHRGAGYENLIQENPDQQVDVPIMLIQSGKLEEMNYFTIINKTQVKLDTVLVSDIQVFLNLNDYEQNLTCKESLEGFLNAVVHRVNHDEDSPIKGWITQIGEDRTDDKPFSQKSFVSCLKPTYRWMSKKNTQWAAMITEDREKQVATIVKTYCNALKECMPVAFKPGEQDSYHLTSNQAAITMMMTALAKDYDTDGNNLPSLLTRIHLNRKQPNDAKLFVDLIRGTRYTDPNHEEFIWKKRGEHNEYLPSPIHGMQLVDEHAKMFLQELVPV